MHSVMPLNEHRSLFRDARARIKVCTPSFITNQRGIPAGNTWLNLLMFSTGAFRQGLSSMQARTLRQ
jgi:hypothetical protein